MKFKPTYDNILVKPAEAVTKVGSFYVPFGTGETHTTGKVLAVGHGIITENGLVPLFVNVDDTVMFLKSTGVEVRIDGQLYLIVKEKDVIGIVEE